MIDKMTCMNCTQEIDISDRYLEIDQTSYLCFDCAQTPINDVDVHLTINFIGLRYVEGDIFDGE